MPKYGVKIEFKRPIGVVTAYTVTPIDQQTGGLLPNIVMVPGDVAFVGHAQAQDITSGFPDAFVALSDIDKEIVAEERKAMELKIEQDRDAAAKGGTVPQRIKALEQTVADQRTKLNACLDSLATAEQTIAELSAQITSKAEGEIDADNNGDEPAMLEDLTVAELRDYVKAKGLKIKNLVQLTKDELIAAIIESEKQ